MADLEDKTSTLNGQQPLQSIKDELPSDPAPTSDSVPPSPRPNGTKSPLAELFRAFAKFGDSKADGKAISLSQSDKWYEMNYSLANQHHLQLK